jgi:hypothetical protein
MKEYKFDYMKEWVLEWDLEVIKNITVDQVLFLPFGLFIFSNPFLDYNGDEVEDISEWTRQREEYAKKLVQEIRFKIRYNVFDRDKELEMLKYASNRCNREENKES